MIANVVPGKSDIETRVLVAAQHLYEAECALHDAKQSQIDGWIAAAADKLHQSLVEHLAAMASAAMTPGTPRPGPTRAIET